MKREELIKLGVADEVVDKIMSMHGADVEANKSKLATASTELAALQAQLTEAGVTIEGFKKLDVEAIRAAADDWKAKAEAAQVEGAKNIAALRFDHALDGSLTSAKAKNSKAVKALLNSADLKLAEDGSIVGLTEQLAKIKSENDYLFESETPTPKIVAGGNNQSVLTDSVIGAARKAAGLPEK